VDGTSRCRTLGRCACCSADTALRHRCRAGSPAGRRASEASQRAPRLQLGPRGRRAGRRRRAPLPPPAAGAAELSMRPWTPAAGADRPTCNITESAACRTPAAPRVHTSEPAEHVLQRGMASTSTAGHPEAPSAYLMHTKGSAHLGRGACAFKCHARPPHSVCWPDHLHGRGTAGSHMHQVHRKVPEDMAAIAASVFDSHAERQRRYTFAALGMAQSLRSLAHT